MPESDLLEPDLVDASLSVARAALAPSQSNQARVRAGLMASRAAPSAKPTLWKRVRASGWTTTALVGLGVLAGYWLGTLQSGASLRTDASPSEAASQPAASQPAMPTAGAVVPSVDPVVAPPLEISNSPRATGIRQRPHGARLERAAARPGMRSSTRAAAQSRRDSSGAGAVDAFSDELSLLSRAERAIRAGQAELALTFLQELEQRYPSSSLVEERAAAQLLADCMLQVPTARARAESVVREHPASVYTDRIRQACALDEPPPASRGTDGSDSPGH